jgi:hypothetical protein
MTFALKCWVGCVPLGAVVGSVHASIDSSKYAWVENAVEGGFYGAFAGALLPVWVPMLGVGWTARQVKAQWSKLPKMPKPTLKWE